MDTQTYLPARDIYRSRTERFEDGSLVDVSQPALRHRFIVPVALTGELYADVRDLSGKYVLSFDTVEGRLKALLHYARAHTSKHLHTSGFSFSLYLPVGNRTTYRVRLLLHGGDDLEDVITISKEESQC